MWDQTFKYVQPNISSASFIALAMIMLLISVLTNYLVLQPKVYGSLIPPLIYNSVCALATYAHLLINEQFILMLFI